MINFRKLYKKAAPFFQISSEIRKGAAQSLAAYGWYSSKDASQRVCIYGTAKNRVHILLLIFKLIPAYFFWISSKNTLDATYSKLHLKCWINMAPPVGLEPTTHGLTVRRSTDWAKGECLCWHYLSFRAVTRQVLSAHVSLTSVFGMGTGGPSQQSIPTRMDDVFRHRLLSKAFRLLTALS